MGSMKKTKCEYKNCKKLATNSICFYTSVITFREKGIVDEEEQFGEPEPEYYMHVCEEHLAKNPNVWEVEDR